jgi:hypothetical protein
MDCFVLTAFERKKNSGLDWLMFAELKQSELWQ